jgi:hypothetical protein
MPSYTYSAIPLKTGEMFASASELSSLLNALADEPGSLDEKSAYSSIVRYRSFLLADVQAIIDEVEAEEAPDPHFDNDCFDRLLDLVLEVTQQLLGDPLRIITVAVDAGVQAGLTEIQVLAKRLGAPLKCRKAL